MLRNISRVLLVLILLVWISGLFGFWGVGQALILLGLIMISLVVAIIRLTEDSSL